MRLALPNSAAVTFDAIPAKSGPYSAAGLPPEATVPTLAPNAPGTIPPPPSVWLAPRIAQDRRPSQIYRSVRVAGRNIIAPRRSNSAHLDRPWRATLRFCATLSPIGRKGRTEPPITATAPTSQSTEETMSQQVGAHGNDRDQHQLLECLRRNFIAHMLSYVHAEHDWQHRNRRD